MFVAKYKLFFNDLSLKIKNLELENALHIFLLRV